MRKYLILLLLAIPAFGQDCTTGPFATTSNLALKLPFLNQCNWGLQGYNPNFKTIDALFPGGVLSIARGGNGTAAPILIAGTNITLTGTWGSYTINATGGGSGNVSNSGTPTVGQIAQWVDATHIDGVTNLTTPGDVYVKGGRPVVDVRAYGAKGDGVTDDLAAINAAVAVASNLGTINSLPTSAILFFPAGNYAISSTIVLPRSISNTNANGVVSVLGESMANTWITALSGFPTGRGIIEWDQTASHRTLGQEIGNITFRDAAVDKQMDIYYQYTSANQPITTSNVVAERGERWYLHDLQFQGNNQYQQYHIYTQGDFFQSVGHRLYTNDARAAAGIAANVYESVLLNTDTCYNSSAPWQEGCGWNWGSLDELGQIGNRGGYSPVFQGRLNQSTLSNSFVNGVRGGFSNSYGFGFINSYSPILTNLGNEGLGDQPQFLFSNTTQCKLSGIYPGAADNQGYGIGDAIDFVASSQCTIEHVNGKQVASQALNLQQWVASTTVSAGGSGYTGTPTATSSGGTCNDAPTYTITLSGTAVSTVNVVNPGNCTGTPTIVIAGTGTGAAAAPTMTGAGTLYWVKLDSNSHQNNFIDLHQTGTADLSFSDLATNAAQWCDQTSSACAVYKQLGVMPGLAKWQGCRGGLGDGANAVTAGAYLESTCYNNTGAPITLTGFKCLTDNNGSSTVSVTNSAGTALLSGAITCTNSYAAGTQSATTTLVNGDWLKFTFTFDGSSKQMDVPVAGSF